MKGGEGRAGGDYGDVDVMKKVLLGVMDGCH